MEITSESGVSKNTPGTSSTEASKPSVQRRLKRVLAPSVSAYTRPRFAMISGSASFSSDDQRSVKPRAGACALARAAHSDTNKSASNRPSARLCARAKEPDPASENGIPAGATA
jgi:hypothetical protein